jgi:hypothetical protein
LKLCCDWRCHKEPVRESTMFPVRYELKFYITLWRNSAFKGLLTLTYNIHIKKGNKREFRTYWNFVAIDGVIKNQLDRCATGCNTQRLLIQLVLQMLHTAVKCQLVMLTAPTDKLWDSESNYARYHFLPVRVESYVLFNFSIWMRALSVYFCALSM